MALSALLASLIAPLAVQPATADRKGDLRAQAAQIQRQLDANGTRIEQLAEQYNGAQLKLQDLDRQIATAQAAAAAAAKVTDHLRDAVRLRAAALYRGGDPAAAAGAGLDSNGAATVYAQSLSARDQDSIDAFRKAEQDQKILEGKLQDAHREQEITLGKIDEAKKQAQALEAQQQATLNSINGQIKKILHDEEVARQRAYQAAVARARQEAANRAAAAAAAARAAQNNQNNGGNGGGGNGSGVDTGTAPGPINPPNPQVGQVIAAAQAQLGKPYAFATAGPNTFDCSGLTMYAWSTVGVYMPHYTVSQYNMFPHVPRDQLQPGDLVFFGSDIHHVGLYVGGGTMIEAPHTGAFVRYASIDRPDYFGAARP